MAAVRQRSPGASRSVGGSAPRGSAAGQPVLVKQGLGKLYPLGFGGRWAVLLRNPVRHGRRVSRGFRSGQRHGEWGGPQDRVTLGRRQRVSELLARWREPCLRRQARPQPCPPFTPPISLVVQSLKNPAADPVVAGFGEFGLEHVVAPCWLADGTAVVLKGYGRQSRELGLYQIDLPGLRKTKVYATGGGRRVGDHECASDSPAVYVQVTTPSSGEGAQPLATDRPDRRLRRQRARGVPGAAGPGHCQFRPVARRPTVVR